MLEKIKTPEELYDYMINNIKYGFKSKDGNIYCRYEMNNDELYEYILFNNYYLQEPLELIKSKYGICYDQVELIRYWMNKNNYKTYSFYTPFHNHAIIMYEDNNKIKIMETTIKKYNGIYEFASIEEAIEEYKKIQLQNEHISNIKLYKYDKVVFGCDIITFIYNISKSKKIINKIKIKYRNKP